MSEAALPTPRGRGTSARILGIGILSAYAVVLIIFLLFSSAPAVREALSGSVLFSASFIAATVCVVAWIKLPAPANLLWLLCGIAGGLASLSHVAELLPAGESRSLLLHTLWLLSNAALLAAVIFAVHQSERGRVTELTLDVALIVTAATLVIVRWAPGAYAALHGDSATTVLLVLFAPVIALAMLLLGAVLYANRPAGLPAPALYGLLLAIAAFAITSLPQALFGATCCHAGAWTTIAAIGVWFFLAYAAVSALDSDSSHVASSSGDRLRQTVAPTVALVLAGVSFEAALHPPIGPRTAVALGILGALVALRLTELLSATRLQVAERRELAQTRALVEVSRALAGKNDLDTTLETVTHWAVKVLNARAAAVELLSADEQTLELRAAEGLPDFAVGMQFPVETSFTGWVIKNGDARVTSNPRRDPFMSAESLRFIGDSPVAAVPLRYRDRLLGVLSCIGTRPFDAHDLDLLRAFANQTALALEDARLFEQVRALSVTDPLTGLANRRQLDRELKREFSAAQRGRRLVAVMFDMDDFKQHNDSHGHLAGDDALRHFAEALRTTTRTMNMAARYGGDEFIALLADADLSGAEVFVTRVRERFNRTMETAGWPMLQISAGMAEYTEDMKTPEDLILAADRALYVSKLDESVNT